MRKLLILPLVCLSLASTLHAQEPKNITISDKIFPSNGSSFSPDGVCNAGTLQIGQHIGQSNDVNAEPIYLCYGDSLFINHDGNGTFMDPNASTAPGVGYGFYECPPTVSGPDIQAIIADPCVFSPPVPSNGIWVATGEPDGDIWLRNFNTLQTFFNGGKPVRIWFAPMTFDDFDQQGFEPGGCIHVNTSEVFSVVYLNEITFDGLQANAGNDCLGRFQIKGGLPEYDQTATYTLDISLASNPSIKAVIDKPETQLKHGVTIFFSAPVAGTYNVTIEDGKSCGKTFTVNMAACNPTDNVTMTVQNTSATPNTNVCVPITVQNMTNIESFDFNLAWDPTVLAYTGIANVSPALVGLNAANFNTISVGSGALGISHFNSNLSIINVPNGQTLFEVCFDVLGDVGDCSTLNTDNFPGLISITNSQQQFVPLTFNAGTVCVGLIPLAVTVTPKDTCNASGSITVRCEGGTAPYDITIQGPTPNTGNIGTGGGTFTATNLNEGAYRVIVVDGGGFIDTVDVLVDTKTLGTNLMFTRPVCAGDCNGQAKAEISFDGFSVTNPGPEYTFQWSFNNLTTQSITGLCVGQYTVTVTNTTEGCTATASGSLDQPQPVQQAGIQIKGASCTGVSNGQINFTAQGGTPYVGGDFEFDFGYSATLGGVPQPQPQLSQTTNPVVLTNLLPGFYTTTVTDAAGCTLSTTIEVPAAKTLDMVAPIQPTNAKCFGSSDGSISVQVNTSPSQANVIQEWTVTPTGIGTPVPGTVSFQLNELPAGQYEFTAVDTAGCTVSESFIVGQPNPLEVTTSNVVNPTCLGVTNGAISTNPPQGGVPTFTYQWSNGATQQNISNLPEGTYTLTVTDANQCKDTVTVSLTLPPPPAVSGVDSVSVKCGNDGCLTVNAAGVNLTFGWTNVSTGAVVGATAQICNLAGGTYAFVVRDAQGCENRDTLILDGKNGLVFADTTYKQPDCFGDENGIVQPTIGGGTPAYEFLWSNGATTPILFGIGAGTYSVTVSDQNDCSLTGTFNLQNPPAISMFFTNIAPASCAGDCDGAADVVANYATVPPTSGNFSFRWEDNPADDSTRTNLCPGFVTVTVTDPNNCFLVDSVFIDSPAPIVADTASYTIPASCDGGSDGVAFVTGAGGNGGPYTYDWGAGFPMQQMQTGLDSGQYIVTIIDGQGCSGTHTLVVLDPDPLNLQLLLSNNIRCAGASDGELGIRATGGNIGIGVTTYHWSNGVDTVGNTDVINQLPAGNYFVTVTDSKGCSGEAGPFTLNDPQPIEGSYLDWEELLCYGDLTTLYIDTIYGGAGGPYQFSLDNGVTLEPDFPISMGGGLHIITYFDSLGCAAEDSIRVFEPEPIVVAFSPPTVEIELGDSTRLIPIITGAAVDSFFWTPIEDLIEGNTLKPYAKNYDTKSFTLTVFDENGCVGTGTVRVEVDPNRNVYLPNAFAPDNTSGLNDRFNPLIGVGVEKVNFMRIYDRWGTLLYERENFFPNNSDYSEGWDGKYDGKKMNPGVYVYLIEVRFVDGRDLLYRGDVTLFR